MAPTDYDNIREVAALFEQHVPEYADGRIRIMMIAREPAQRTKVAVFCDSDALDPVEVCVGPEAGRIRAIVEALNGEKIDIVPFDENDVRFVCNALAPAVVTRVFLDDENRTMELVVPDESFPAALGTDGVNLRLAAILTGWRLDLIRESRYEAQLQPVRDVCGEHAQALISAGYTTVEWVAEATVDDLVDFAGLDAGVALQVIAAAREAV